MNADRLNDALKATMEPEQRGEAEKYLSEAQNIAGFTPALLQIVMAENRDGPVRQAAVIYLKNVVGSYWDEKPGEPDATKTVLTILEQDRHVLREHIVEAIIHSPEVIRVQLAVAVATMLKYDFPAQWPGIVGKLIVYLNANDGQSLMGALVVLYQLVKNFEFKKQKDRVPLVQAMTVILPIIYERMIHLMPDPSQESAYLQKMVLKIFYALVQFSLSLEMLSIEDFGRWMELVRQVVERPVPAETESVDEEDRPELVWWKCKKWAIHLMARIFERYGNPGQVSAEYNKFAEFYLKNFAAPSIGTIFKVLDSHRRKEYVAPRVLHQALSYLQCGISHSFSWKFIKPHILQVIQEIVYPLCCHSDKDEELWQDDPQEYIRTKYDVFDELVNPTNAAVALLGAAMKRKDLLGKTVGFIVQVMNSHESTPQQLDGALHMVGTLAPNLLKKKVYKNELENMLLVHVYPRFDASNGFLRARAAWCITQFSEVPFKDDSNLRKAIELPVRGLLQDPEMPVKVECALALQMLLTDQTKAEAIIQEHIKPIVLQLLKLISDTENDDLTTVMSKFINVYTEQITPIAVEIAQGLGNIFVQLLQTEEGAEDRAITAMGVLNTLENILDVVEDQKEIVEKLEAIVVTIVRVIIEGSVMDFYEEALSLVYSLTCTQISPTMWQVFRMIHKMFTDDGIDYFIDMMPALHNYVTVDPDAFISDPERIQIIYDMCKKIFSDDVDAGAEAECHAGKLLEVIVLQYRGRIDALLRPITEIVLARLAREIKSSELRTMCLQVLIAGLHYNPPLMLEILNSFQPPDSNLSIVDQFVKQWLFDVDCFLGLHDRKMCIIGLTTLMGMHGRPVVMHEVGQQVVPSCISLFDELQKAYEAKALRENKDDDSDSGEEVEDGDALESDEDEVDEEAHEYMERLAKSEQDSGNDDEYSDEDLVDETDLESYETVLDTEDADIDEYVMFKNTLLALQQTEPQWYQMLVGSLTPEQQASLQNIFKLADQKFAALESKKIEKGGGYQFNVQQIPTTFNFGGSAFS